MTSNTFIDNAKVMAKGQITIPKDVREILGISNGDRVTFVVENGNVRLINSAVYAMQILQSKMVGEAEASGLTSDDAVMDLVKEIRAESEA
ncbi:MULTISPECIES: AbrB/MazE/SpoVT family DNA-binding domain-containing protein [Lachnospiraceae]|uniref:AbrB/MazE/SpoVT family DNA-binding domain-containing protein n=4 Tax=Lachnospiraceae TaxID=186803 RepID=A0A923LAK6_9FIRM|nr:MULTISPECIES: AbrB/MazE/SpoVT family DNA-binding domain-containing protein [Lachnospiraceae]SCH45536.1 transcriptional regulator%2C AbrB family [uncultured Clostridium sp.]MBC5659031.1 AbrB/MazE/SpoVT family DNA-binding domain-containing protein [Anaerosacchariphilus hominis]MBC5698699.1 AbrB/MazE/SpoVT family DNA-binding domain-containing protein [Roseburia difficilis]MCU6696915.1 AbrB/MazE/SpoVT family DNA-binding domain-containing protein [Laedolimicola ammoniilytica]SCH98763.1 transcrip